MESPAYTRAHTQTHRFMLASFPVTNEGEFDFVETSCFLHLGGDLEARFGAGSIFGGAEGSIRLFESDFVDIRLHAIAQEFAEVRSIIFYGQCSQLAQSLSHAGDGIVAVEPSVGRVGTHCFAPSGRERGANAHPSICSA